MIIGCPCSSILYSSDVLSLTVDFLSVALLKCDVYDVDIYAFLKLLVFYCFYTIRHDTIRYIYVHSKSDKMASLV